MTVCALKILDKHIIECFVYQLNPILNVLKVQAIEICLFAQEQLRLACKKVEILCAMVVPYYGSHFCILLEYTLLNKPMCILRIHKMYQSKTQTKPSITGNNESH